MEPFLPIHPTDTVAVALEALAAGTALSCGITLTEEIPAGHKFALKPHLIGAPVVKYGYPIGTAKTEILPGQWVHTHNVRSALEGLLEYSYTPEWRDLPEQKALTFRGYRRPNGKVGIRNEVWIIPTVGCVNAIARQIEIESQQFLTPELDGIFSYSHPYGCSQLGGDQLLTQKALCGLIQHPNAAAVLVLGLGCENNTMDEMKAMLGPVDPNRVKFLVCQESEDEIEDALVLMEQLCSYARQFHREECPASELTVGLKCGGSDGFSGITANPLVGAFSDRLLAQGGSTILTEVPEMFGSEQILMNRCRNNELFEQTVSLINDFKSYFLRYGEKVDENPSPGNKKGGITTLEDKSLGCTQKAGSAPVSGVLQYGDPVTVHGLNLLQSPGNDLVASCALAFSGAQIILFTTGRGTPFGCPVPTVKVASNTPLATRKKNWIDFDAGRLLSEEVPMDTLADEFFRQILAIASGECHAKSEALDKRDLAIFKDGVTL